MVLTLDGSSEYAAHMRCFKRTIYFTVLGQYKCLKRIISLVMCVSISEIPSNRRTVDVPANQQAWYSNLLFLIPYYYGNFSRFFDEDHYSFQGHLFTFKDKIIVSIFIFRMLSLIQLYQLGVHIFHDVLPDIRPNTEFDIRLETGY